MPQKLCSLCQDPIPPDRARFSWAKFCSRKCAIRSEKSKAPKSAYPGISCPTVGAIHELIVCADLLKRGFQVFRAVSPASDCDLAVLKQFRLIRVEVTTGYISKTGALQYPKHDDAKSDALAVVVAGEIHYLPKVSEWYKIPHLPHTHEVETLVSSQMVSTFSAPNT